MRVLKIFLLYLVCLVVTYVVIASGTVGLYIGSSILVTLLVYILYMLIKIDKKIN